MLGNRVSGSGFCEIEQELSSGRSELALKSRSVELSVGNRTVTVTVKQGPPILRSTDSWKVIVWVSMLVGWLLQGEKGIVENQRLYNSR